MDTAAPWRGSALGLASALLFGLGAPLSKLILPRTQPVPLAALLYLGAAAAFFATRRGRDEAPLTRSDAPWLAGSVIAGAALAPILMLWGLTRVSGLAGCVSRPQVRGAVLVASGDGLPVGAECDRLDAGPGRVGQRCDGLTA